MTKLTLVTSALICLAGTQFAHAQDWKGYTGLSCLPTSSSNNVSRSLSGIRNNQATSTTIYCPVVRDISAGGPNGIQQARVRLFNNNATTGGWCRLVSRTLSGTTHDWQQQTWPAGYGMRTVTFNNIDTSNWGNIALYCSIPGVDGARKSFIKSYSVREN